jgi:hypothetical protein
MHLIRGFLVWLVIMFAESVHGTLRQFFLAPAVGDFTARRISFFTGMLLIFVITYLLLRWIGAPTSGSLLVIGTMWAVLTLAFEFGIGFLVLGYSRERVFEDYDISRGGLMGFGIVFMLSAPYLAARLRGLRFTS